MTNMSIDHIHAHNRGIEAHNANMLKRSVEKQQAKRRKVGALLVAATLTGLAVEAHLSDYKPAVLPAADSKAAQEGLKDGKYQKYSIGQTVTYQGQKEVLDTISEIAMVSTDKGRFDDAVIVSSNLVSQLDQYNKIHQTDYNAGNLPLGTDFIVENYQHSDQK